MVTRCLRRGKEGFMFHPNTFKTKTFFTSLATIAAGAALCYTGNVAPGAPMIAGGLLAITGRDALSKLLASMAVNAIGQARQAKG
jgi:hypothetical protein